MFNKRKRPSPMIIISTVALAVIVVFGSILAIRAIRSTTGSDPVFERVEQPLLADDEAEPSSEVEAADADPSEPIEAIDVHHFDEDAYLSRKLTLSEARALAMQDVGTGNITLAAPATQNVEDEPSGRYRYATVVLNLRKGPDANTELLRSVWANERVFEKAVEGEWSHITTSDSLEGYVLTAYLTDGQTEQKTTATTTKETTPTAAKAEAATTPKTTSGFTSVDRMMYVAEDVVNVRKAPTTDSDVVTTASKGERLRVTAVGASWSNVTLNSGQSGYILSSLLSASEVRPASTTSPATTTPPTTPPTTAPTGPTFTSVDRIRYINVDAANVRKSPSTSGDILTTLSSGTEVKVTGVGDGWSRVAIGSGTGYISSSLLTETKPSAPTTPPTTPPSTEPKPTEPAFKAVDKEMYVDVSSANVRRQPNTSSDILARLSRGTAVKVTGEGTGWSRVALSSGTGYISSSLLTGTKPTTPPTTAPTTPAPTNPPTTPPSGSTINFVKAGSTSAAWTNFEKLRPYLRKNGDRNYNSFTNNGNGTITVDGLTFAYTSAHDYGATHYDGVQVSRARGENPVRNRNTASGIPAQRGLVAMRSINLGGLPFGTVVFVEGYGLAVVADRGPLSSRIQIDLCYDPDESGSVRPYGFKVQKTYIISIP